MCLAPIRGQGFQRSDTSSIATGGGNNRLAAQNKRQLERLHNVQKKFRKKLDQLNEFSRLNSALQFFFKEKKCAATTRLVKKQNSYNTPCACCLYYPGFDKQSTHAPDRIGYSPTIRMFKSMPKLPIGDDSHLIPPIRSPGLYTLHDYHRRWSVSRRILPVPRDLQARLTDLPIGWISGNGLRGVSGNANTPMGENLVI